MKHLDLFSGIGGFALAAKWLGIETVAFCEIEEFPQKVLKKNFPHIPIHNDVRKTDEFVQYRGETDILTGGYPCQPFSVAGKRRGEEDDRHLWPAMLEIIKTVRPSWVLAENVAGHIKMGLDQVLSDMEGEGYSARAVVVPACAVNAPHRRDRVWIIANTSGSGERGEREEPGNEGRSSSEIRGEGIRQEDGEKRSIRSNSTTSNATDSKGGRTRKCRNCNHGDGGEESGRCVDWWATEPAVGRLVDGIPDRVDRLKGLGNAIVPQVAYEIMRAIFNK